MRRDERFLKEMDSESGHMQNFFETSARTLLNNRQSQAILVFVSNFGFVSLNRVLGKAIAAVPVGLLDLLLKLCCFLDKLFNRQERVFAFAVFFDFLLFLFVWVLLLLRKIFLVLGHLLGLFDD